jgi:hypothetical protein
LNPIITFLTADSQEYISEQTRIILDVFQQLEKVNIPIRNIVEIKITDDYSNTFSNMHGSGSYELKKRGYYSTAKNFIDKEGKSTKILFNRKYVDFRLADSIIALISQLTDVNLPEIEELPNSVSYDLQHALKAVLHEFAIKVITFHYLNKFTFTLNGIEYRVCEENNISLLKTEAALNREIKKLHFKYQRDKDINAFWISIVQNLSFYCNQAIYASDKNSKDCHLKSIYDSMVSAVIAVLDHKEDITSEIQQTVCAYLVDHNLKIDKNPDGTIKLRIIINPKDFYKQNNVVEIEDRIVCFADILGFKNIVEEYNKNPNSTVLQDLKEALDSAYSISLCKFAQNSQLDYRVFSDCLCISTPYFDDEDFFTQLFVISQSIKVFQTQLMFKGFFVRGAIAFGSHYEDKNMIFSQALIEAYLIESNKKEDNKARYSRIALSKSLVDKLRSQTKDLENKFPWNESFVLDNCDNVIFLNPFDILHNFPKNINYMKEAFENACQDLGTDPLINNLKSITTKALDATLDLITPHIENNEIFKPFVDMLNSKIIEYADNDKYRQNMTG